MTTELLRQITDISKEIKNIHGDDYGEQYCNVAINLLNNNSSNINEYQILIEAAHSLIDSDYKDKLIFNLQKKIKEQDSRILNLEKETKDLKQDNIVLKINNDKLTKQVNKLEDDKQKFDAFIKLHEYTPKLSKNEIKELKGRDTWLEKQLGLENLLDKDTVEMSGGQKKECSFTLLLLQKHQSFCWMKF
jgi:hypothetical protein